MKRNYLIDRFKYLAAVGVVFAHVHLTHPINSLGIHWLVNGLVRLAVPFFFICSGYFLSKKDMKNPQVVKTFTLNQAKRYGILSLIYIPIAFVQMIFLDQLDFGTYLHEVVVKGTFLHLWYFPALILATWLVHLGLRRLCPQSLVLLLVPIYAFGLLGEGYHGLLELIPGLSTLYHGYEGIFLTTRNGLFLGLPFIFMGWSMGYYKHEVKGLEPKLMVSLILLLVEVSLLDYLNLARDYNLVLGIIPASYYMFKWILKTSSKRRLHKKTPAYARNSVFLYEYHLLVYGLLLGFMAQVDLDILNFGLVRFIIVYGICQGLYLVTQWKRSTRTSLRHIIKTRREYV